MKLFKQVLCYGLALALSAGCLSGCSGKNTETAGETDAVDLKIFSDAAVNETGDPAWLAHVEEAKGIKLSVEAPPSTSYVERLQIMLASGDYPDLVCFRTNGTEFVDAANGGVLIPINKYLEGKENLKKYTYEQSWDAMKVKQTDEIYGIPRSTMMRQDGFYIRADWLRKLGMRVPEDRTLTLAEFREILERFTYDDPDGNGKDDTYGIASYNDATKGMALTVEETFHLFGWQKANGGDYEYMDPKYSRTDDSFKKALAFNAQLFADKLIDPDAPTITTYVNSTERFKRGITGVLRAFPAYVDDYIDEMRKINPEADICMVTSITDDAGNSKVGTPYGAGFFGLWGVTAASKHPDKVVDLLDWMLSDDEWPTTMYGMEGVCYNMEGTERKFVPDVYQGIGKSIVRRNTDADFYLSTSSEHVGFDTIREALSECMDNAVYGLDRGFTPSNATEPSF
ncbi:MAG: extracellular solute-binding protein, partial [Clostridia bacterium]